MKIIRILSNLEPQINICELLLYNYHITRSKLLHYIESKVLDFINEDNDVVLMYNNKLIYSNKVLNDILLELKVNNSVEIILQIQSKGILLKHYLQNKNNISDINILLSTLNQLYLSNNETNHYLIQKYAYVYNQPELYSYFSEKIKNDYVFLIDIVLYHPIILKYVSDNLKNDYNFVVKVIKINSDCYMYASEKMQENNKIILETCKHKYITNVNHILNKVNNNRQLLSKICLIHPFILNRIPIKFILDKDFIIPLIRKSGLILQYLNLYKNDYTIVDIAIKNNPLALKYASQRMQNNYNIVLEAVKRNGYSLDYASFLLKNNYNIVVEAVKQNGYALQYASNMLKNNYNIVIEAVKKTPTSFKYASYILRNDRNILMCAYSLDKNILKYAPYEFKEYVRLYEH